MADSEVKRVIVRPEQVLTPKEAGIIKLADRGDLPCPRCPEGILEGYKIVGEIYTGVMLWCDSCRYFEP